MHRISFLAVCMFCFLVTLAPCSVYAEQASQPGELEYTLEQIQSTSAEVFLARMKTPEPGYQKFAALHALGRKAKESNPEARKAILDMVVVAMNDRSRIEYQRFQCCYVISDCGDEQWVPSLIDVLMKDPSEVMRSVAAEALGYFTNSTVAYDALDQAYQLETSERVREVLKRRLNQGNAEYTPEQIKNTSAEIFLERMQNPEAGYQKFAAMHALGRKAKESDASTRLAILKFVISAMNDRSRTEFQRFQCCYVISDSYDVRGIPALIDVLTKDPSETMRSVAAEALGYFACRNNKEAYNALVLASKHETSQRVLDVIAKYISPKKTSP